MSMSKRFYESEYPEWFNRDYGYDYKEIWREEIEKKKRRKKMSKVFLTFLGMVLLYEIFVILMWWICDVRWIDIHKDMWDLRYSLMYIILSLVFSLLVNRR